MLRVTQPKSHRSYLQPKDGMWQGKSHARLEGPAWFLCACALRLLSATGKSIPTLEFHYTNHQLTVFPWQVSHQRQAGWAFIQTTGTKKGYTKGNAPSKRNRGRSLFEWNPLNTTCVEDSFSPQGFCFNSLYWRSQRHSRFRTTSCKILT